jgi:hypothetical protein
MMIDALSPFIKCKKPFQSQQVQVCMHKVYQRLCMQLVTAATIQTAAGNKQTETRNQQKMTKKLPKVHATIHSRPDTMQPPETVKLPAEHDSTGEPTQPASHSPGQLVPGIIVVLQELADHCPFGSTGGLWHSAESAAGCPLQHYLSTCAVKLSHACRATERMK